MNHKIYWLIIPFVLPLIVLAGFSTLLPITVNAERKELSASQYEPVTITYWHHNTGAREEFLNHLIAEFNSTNPYSITVIGEYAGNYGQIRDSVISGLQNSDYSPH